MDDVYEELVHLKRKDESFSDLLREMAKKKKGNILAYAGILSHWPKERWDHMEKVLSDARMETNKRKIPQW